MGRIILNGIDYPNNGIEALNDLNDVDITNPSDGQVLKYDATNQEWVNANESGGGGSYTAGDGINISNDEISVDTTFTEASTRSNINSGDTLATIWGKIKKFFSDLKTVAFTGSYTDLTDKPTIPSAQVNSDWNASSGVAQILNKPTIPTVNNGTLTIQKNGTNVATFSANQSGNATANITVPTQVPDIASGFSSQGSSISWGNQTGTAIFTLNDSTGGSVGFRRDNPSSGKMSMVIDGTIYVDEGNKAVIHSGNIGSQSVNYATSAGSATSATSATTATNANNLNNNTRMEYGWNGVNYFNLDAQASSTVKQNNGPTKAWWHILRFNHANANGYYTDLAIPFNNTGIYYKRVTNGTVQNNGWVQVWDKLSLTNLNQLTNGPGYITSSGSCNYATSAGSATDSTKLPLAGGTMTGDLRLNSGKILYLNNPANSASCQLFTSSNTTLQIVTTAWLNLRSGQQVQCRNAGDTGWCNIAAANISSSRRYKENIQDLTEDEARKLLDIRTVTFDFKEQYAPSDDWEHERFHQQGVIAEEVVDIYPTLVRYSNYENPDEEPIPTFVEYSHFVPYLIKMVQMQQKEIDELKAIIKGNNI